MVEIWKKVIKAYLWSCKGSGPLSYSPPYWSRLGSTFSPTPMDPSDHIPYNLGSLLNQFLSLHTLTLKMEAASSSEMLVSTCNTTHYHNPEDNMNYHQH
jgi:hypothetical protein